MKKRIVTVFILLAVILGLFVYIGKKKENNFYVTNEVTYIISENNNGVYKNKVFDYEIMPLPDMKIDESLAGIRTRLYNENVDVDIFFDDFTDEQANFDVYSSYGNKFLENIKYHTNIEDKKTSINGHTARIIKFSRDKLDRIKNDKNYYCTVEIKANDKMAYTMLIKSNSEISSDIMDVVNSFKIGNTINKYEIPDNYFKIVDLNVNEDTKKVYDNYFVTSDKLTWGIFEPNAPKNFDNLDKIEESIGKGFEFLIRYQSFNTPLPVDEIVQAYNRGKIVELTPQTMNTVNGELDIYEILDGKYDEYLNNYAKDIKALNVPILFRLNNEMNGDWCGYSAYYYAKDTDLYKESWKYIYNIFKNNGVDNVLWVWNANHKSFPNFKWNNALLYYPGDEYVDIIGLTAYNTGNYYDGEKWSSFDELYKEYYEEYNKIFEKPLMITEFGSSTYGGDKVQWVKDMFNSLKNYPDIKVAIWWSHTDFDSNGSEARVYRIDTPAEVLEVFRERINIE